MNYRISGKNIEVTEGLRTAVQDKLNKLEKYFTDETEIQVTFSVEKDRQKIEVTIPVKGSVIRAEQVSDDMYVSIDLVEEVIERQVNRFYIFIIEYLHKSLKFSNNLHSFFLYFIFCHLEFYSPFSFFS